MATTAESPKLIELPELFASHAKLREEHPLPEDGIVVTHLLLSPDQLRDWEKSQHIHVACLIKPGPEAYPLLLLVRILNSRFKDLIVVGCPDTDNMPAAIWYSKDGDANDPLPFTQDLIDAITTFVQKRTNT